MAVTGSTWLLRDVCSSYPTDLLESVIVSLGLCLIISTSTPRFNRNLTSWTQEGNYYFLFPDIIGTDLKLISAI